MRKKPKSKSTVKKTLSDNTLIRLKRDTVSKLKNIQYKMFNDTGMNHSYDEVINNLLNN